MGTLLRAFGGPTHGLAVQSHCFFVIIRTTGVDPGGEHQLEMTCTQARQEAAIEGTGWRVKVAWPKHTLQEQAVVMAPLSDGLKPSCNCTAMRRPSTSADRADHSAVRAWNAGQERRQRPHTSSSKRYRRAGSAAGQEAET